MLELCLAWSVCLAADQEIILQTHQCCVESRPDSQPRKLHSFGTDCNSVLKDGSQGHQEYYPPLTNHSTTQPGMSNPRFCKSFSAFERYHIMITHHVEIKPILMILKTWREQYRNEITTNCVGRVDKWKKGNQKRSHVINLNLHTWNIENRKNKSNKHLNVLWHSLL